MPRANFEHLRVAVDRVADVPGDFAEIGVWRGATFRSIARAAADAGRVAVSENSKSGHIFFRKLA